MVVVVTVLIAVLEPHLPALSLLVLYMLAVLPVAVLWGAGPAVVISVLSTVLFGYLFLPPGQNWWFAEARNLVALGVFLVTTVVVANLAAQGRRVAQESTRLTQEQAALRRVATLVAQGVPSPTVFEAVTREVGMRSGADLARMERYDPSGAVTGVAAWSRVPGRLAVGTRFDLDGVSIARQVRQTRGPVRVGSFAGATGSIAVEALELGIRSSVGCPILVEGDLWGVIAASSKSETPFPPGTESQITRFTELVAMAIANAQSRVELNQLALEQAALRRVATLVASGAAPQDVFTAVTDEVARLLEVDATILLRFEPDAAVTLLAGRGWSGQGVRLGERVDAAPVATAPTQTDGPWRIEELSPAPTLADAVRREGIVASIACAVTVEGRVWGALGVGSRTDPLLPDAERRIEAFTELVAKAIIDAEARAELRRIAGDQAALRRVATLAARGGEGDRVFATVVEEVSNRMGADCTGILRFETDGTATFMGGRGWRSPELQQPGARWKVEPPSVAVTVLQTGCSARAEYSDAPETGTLAPTLQREGIRSSTASPIVVEGRPWGMIGVASRSGPLPADTEQRLIDFTEIIAIAIANTESRSEVAASRARVIAEADAARRQLERDLHDGAQQRLVSLALELRNAEDAVPAEVPGLRADVGRIAHELTEVLDELREFSRGIHPAILSEGGLGPALRTLARRSGVPAEVDLRTQSRFPEPIEVAAYYVVSEALTNATKHAGASHVEILVEERAGSLRLCVRDDGVGGADPHGGSGLTGLRDRLEALGGSIHVSSPVGNGTVIQVSLPFRR
jgi:signal transduction histidine kinase